MASISSLGPIICSAYDPTRTLLASGIIALDTHEIKVQSINPSQSSLNTSFSLEKGSRLNSIRWVPSGHHHFLALNLTKGSTLIYSPLSNEVVAELETTYNSSILDFHYSKYSKSAWSCDVGGSVYEWDMVNFKLLQTIKFSELLDNVETITKISSVHYLGQPHLLVGSHSIYLVLLATKQVVKTFPGHVQPINNILHVDHDLFFTTAKGDRFINLYSLSKIGNKAIFVALGSVLDISFRLQNQKSVLTVINENGNLEIFNDPLVIQESTSLAVSKKKRRHQQASAVQSRSSNAIIKLSRPELEIKSPQDSNLYINAATASLDSIIITWLESGSIPHFDSFKWLDELAQFLIHNDNTIFKSKPNLKILSHSTEHGHDIAAPKLYTELHTIVNDGTNLKDLDDDEDEDKDEESLADKLDKLSLTDTKSKPTKSSAIFGGKTGTLTTVLAQSLKNNDHSLLESVLANRDAQIIQNTITKLDPSLAVILMDRISERIQRQASKFDQLKVWLRWVIIIHGAVLASLPNLSIQLYNLHSVLSKKASSLPRLLELQGRMNILHQQNELRREILTNDLKQEEDFDSDVEYIEEIDDAQELGIIEDDEDEEDSDDMEIIEGQDDYVESGEEGEVEEELIEGDDSDVENYSDLEADSK